MALDANGLAAAIAAANDSIDRLPLTNALLACYGLPALSSLPVQPPAVAAAIDAFTAANNQALATAIITYLVANAVIVGTAAGALGGGPGVPVIGTLT